MPMEDVVNRIRMIMESEDHSPASFADALGIGRPLMSHVLSGRNNPSLQLILKILEKFPSYSADWLVRGLEKNDSIQESNDAKMLNPETPLIDELADPAEIKTTKKLHYSEKLVSNSGITRTMLFYEDGTFDEYKPRK